MALSPPSILHSRFTPTHLPYLLLLASSVIIPAAVVAIDVTAVLSRYPDFSSFAALVSSTPLLTEEVAHRSSLTILAVPNAHFSTSAVSLTRHLSPFSRVDLLRYHVLLQYFSSPDLRRIPPSGVLVTTLYQTTGRAPSNFGAVNLTRDPATDAVTVLSPASQSPSNAAVIGIVKTIPYDLAIVSVDSLLVPYGFDPTGSESRPPPLGVNITKALIDGRNFFIAASMLSASGVVEEFEADRGGAGITMFVPTDAAFSDLGMAGGSSLRSLPAGKKAVVLRFHVLHSYYPLGSLESIVNPVQPTLATEEIGAGRFTVNISRVDGSVAIDSGIVRASVTQTVFDQNPVAIFGVSKVLLPREIFGGDSAVTRMRPENQRRTEAAEKSPSDVDPERFRLSSPVNVNSAAGGERLLMLSLAPFCFLHFLKFLV